jgi:hypothetical protein
MIFVFDYENKIHDSDVEELLKNFIFEINPI